MLKGFSKESTLAFLKQKKDDRESFYLQAKLKLPLACPTVNDIKQLLLDAAITL
jgi:hypothetical protein